MAENLGITPVMNGGPPAPIEGSTPNGGGFGPAYNSAWWANASATALTRTIGDAKDPTPVAYDDAVKAVKAQGLDPAFVPAAGMPRGALEAEMVRQSQIKYDQLKLTRSDTSSWTQNAAGLAAGATDPINLALPVAGVAGRVGLGVGGRLAAGAAEGAAYVGGQRAAQLGLSGHMEDLASWETLNQITLGAGAGGLAHGMFGPRALVRPGENVTTDTIATLEGSEAAANRQGTDAAHVISPTGAVGLHQVEPATARGLGLKGTDAEITKQLEDPAVNKAMSQKLLDQLARQYGNDPEAIAVAYNAGPGRADAWKAAGRDDRMLSTETQGYLARLRGIPMQTRVAAGSLAMSQMASDNDVDVAPVFKTNPFKIRDEHDVEVSQMTSQAYKDAMPDPQRVTVPPDAEDRLSKMADNAKVNQNGLTEEPNYVQEAKQQIAALDTSGLEISKDDLIGASFKFPIKGGGLIVGDVTKNGNLRISTASQPAEAQGKGFGTEAYAKLAQQAIARGGELHSDVEVSALAAKIYEKLKTKGYGVQKNSKAILNKEGKWESPNGPVFKVTSAPVPVRSPLKEFENAMSEAATAHEPGTNLTHDDLTKATQAAVNCGAMKGVSFGD